MAGSYLAVEMNVPILMYSKKTVKNLQDYIKSSLNENGTIYILGGLFAPIWIGTIFIPEEIPGL